MIEICPQNETIRLLWWSTKRFHIVYRQDNVQMGYRTLNNLNWQDAVRFLNFKGVKYLLFSVPRRPVCVQWKGKGERGYSVWFANKFEAPYYLRRQSVLSYWPLSFSPLIPAPWAITKDFMQI